MSTDAALSPRHKTAQVPAWLKWAYTAFLAILVPVYWVNYGPTNFLYFCDVALFLTLIAIWTEKPFFASLAAVGIMVPQLLWCVDFSGELLGLQMSGMTAYMFDEGRSLFLRGLSLFHGWLPFLLLFLVRRLGYDSRAFLAWVTITVVLCLFSFFLLPPAGAVMPDPKTPVNVNYVFGLNDAKPQTWLPAGSYLVVWMVVLILVANLPAHFFLKRFARP